MKILIIDDDKYLTSPLKSSLEHNGHTVFVINKAKDLLDDLTIINEYNLIILDLMMRKPQNLVVPKSKETGETIFEKIKEINKDIKIIIVTGKDNGDIKTNFKALKIPLLTKPFNAKFENLYKVIDDVM